MVYIYIYVYYSTSYAIGFDEVTWKIGEFFPNFFKFVHS